MEKPKLKKVLYWGTMPVVAIFLFMLGLGIGLADNETIEVEKEVEVIKEVPVETVKEVEKIVYKDSPETLEMMDSHIQISCSFTSVYPSMLDIMEAYASDWGLSSMMTQDMYTLESIASEYQSKYCN